MLAIRKALTRLVAQLTSAEVEKHGAALALIDRRAPADAWFSYRAQIRWLLEREAIDCVIDVGANQGQFGRQLRKFYSSELISFEPVAAAYAELKSRAQADSRWRVYQLGLGSRDETVQIHVSRGSVFSSLLNINQYAVDQFGARAEFAHDEEIQIRRLDAVVAEWPQKSRRIFLKLDTQGYDAAVFAGASGVLKDVVLLQSEISLIPIYDGMPHWTEMISLYERAGFRIIGMFPVNRDNGEVIEYDCLMVRATERTG